MAKAKLSSDLLLQYRNYSEFGLVTSAFIHTYKKKKSLKKFLPCSLHDAHTVHFLVRKENKEKKKKKGSTAGLEESHLLGDM